MKITNRQVYFGYQGLQRLGEAMISGDDAYEIGMIIESLEAIANSIEKGRVALIKQYGSDGRIAPGDENFDIFQEEFEKILNIEQDIPLKPLYIINKQKRGNENLLASPNILKQCIPFIRVINEPIGVK